MKKTLTFILLLSSLFASAQFQGAYSVGNWTLSNVNDANGTVDTSDMPNSFTLTGSNNSGDFGVNTFYTITIPTTTQITFDWHYTTTDNPGTDHPNVVVNGNITQFDGFDRNGALNQSGSMTVNVYAGDSFAFNIDPTDGCCGAGIITISNFMGGPSLPAAPTASAQTFCAGKTVADLVATGTDLKWYDVATNGTALSTSTALATGTYYVSQTVSGNESERTSVIVTVHTTAAPIASAQTFCGSKTVADLVANGTDLQWYADATGGTALASTTAIATGNYYVSQTLNSCEGPRTLVSVTVNTTGEPTAAAQTFCGSKTVADLVATGTDLQWYDVATNGSALAATTAIATGTYYVSQTLNSCEGARTLVAVTVNNSVAGTVSNDQLIFIGTSPADITLTGNEGAVQWQSSLDNSTFADMADATGTTLTGAQVGTLTTKRYYRAVVTNGSCASATSGVITVTVIPATKVQVSQCDATLATLNTAIIANSVVGVSNYRFKVVNGATTETIETVDRWFRLTSLAAGVLYNTTYTISVATKFNGVWGPYGDECNVTTPAPLTKVQASQCGQTLAALNTAIVANTISIATHYRFKVVQGATSETFETASRFLRLTSLTSGVLYNTTYTISVAIKYNGVWGDYGDACTVNTPAVPLTKVQASQCGTTLATLNTGIIANSVSGATHYRFKVVSGATSETIETASRWFYLKSLAGGALYNTTYTISVASKYNGVWSDFGEECTVTTPGVPATKIQVSQCGTTLPALSTAIVANTVVGVSNYRFKVVNGTTTRYAETTSRWFYLKSLTGGGLYSTTYTISVATKYNGVWGDYGDECSVTTPSAPLTRPVDLETETNLAAFKVTGYPNPYTNTFKLDINTQSSAVVNVRVYDMVGKLIEVRNSGVAELSTMEIGDHYATGVYNVIVTQGTEVKSLRMIKK